MKHRNRWFASFGSMLEKSTPNCMLKCWIALSTTCWVSCSVKRRISLKNLIWGSGNSLSIDAGRTRSAMTVNAVSKEYDCVDALQTMINPQQCDLNPFVIWHLWIMLMAKEVALCDDVDANLCDDRRFRLFLCCTSCWLTNTLLAYVWQGILTQDRQMTFRHWRRGQSMGSTIWGFTWSHPTGRTEPPFCECPSL